MKFLPCGETRVSASSYCLSVQHGLKLHQVDVATAFLNGTLEEEVFMKQPEGFEVKEKEHLICVGSRRAYYMDSNSSHLAAGIQPLTTN